MKTALVSHLYPNRAYPASGTFIRELYLGLKDSVETAMLVPTVRAIPVTNRWRYTHTPFLSPGEAVRLRYLSVPKKRLPHLVRYNLSKALLRYLGKNPVDLVHVNWLFPDGLAIPALKKQGIPVILTIHGSDWYKTRENPLLADLLHQSLLQTDMILTVGTRLREEMLNAQPGLKEKIRVTHNSVDFNKFQPPASRREALAGLSWNPDLKHILCVANFSHEKGVDVLMEAFKKLNPPDTILHLIGNIPDEVFARSLAARADRNQKVIRHPPVPHDRIVAYYRACDLFVLPSRREGFGLALAEAVACGKPVISTNSGGPEEIVNENNGFLAEPGNPDQLAETMETVLSGSFEKNSEEIRSSILERFNKEKIIEQLTGIYREVLRQ